MDVTDVFTAVGAIATVVATVIAVLSYFNRRKMSPSTPTSSPTFRNTIGMEFVLIPAGEFMMGSSQGGNDEQPVHKVEISQPFYLGIYPVTQGEWRAVMWRIPRWFVRSFWVKFTGNSNRPVKNVSWNDVQRFMEKLNERERGTTYRLPTEAEWEYAARAGTKETRYHKNIDVIAWYDENSNQETHAVGRKLPNAWGLYDMLGNVWECVQDRYDEEYYKSSPARDPHGPDEGASRVIRGGCWYLGARGCRAAFRFFYAPDDRGYALGFRLARSAALGP